MRYCPYCGMQLPDDVRFCTRCGADVSSIQMPSQQPVPQPYIPPRQYSPQPLPTQPAYTLPPPKKHGKTGGIVAVFLLVAIIIIAGIVIISAQQSSYTSPQPNPTIVYLLTHGNQGDVELYVYTESSGNVYFYVDGKYQGVSNASSNSYVYCPTFSASQGNHTFYATKYDPNGNYQGSTSSITKYIVDGNTTKINLGTLP